MLLINGLGGCDKFQMGYKWHVLMMCIFRLLIGFVCRVGTTNVKLLNVTDDEHMHVTKGFGVGTNVKLLNVTDDVHMHVTDG